MKNIILVALLVCTKSFCQNFDYKNYNLFLSNYVTSDGNVKYDQIKANKESLTTIINLFTKNQPTSKWTKDEKMAYYINLYNVNTLKIVIENYPVKSIKDINKVWDKKFISSGKVKISLSDIENKILRKMGESRIHFAINCASFSCPKLNTKAFMPLTLNTQLEAATKNFINDKNKNTLGLNEIKISELFKWYKEDFVTKTTTIIDYLNKYSDIKIETSAKIGYLDYNWSLNK